MSAGEIEFTVDGTPVTVADRGSLLDALRDQVGIRSAKDGCSPQGQCGCCTVLVDGAARVACVTPVGRVRGRAVTTVDGIADADRWARACAATGASQCGFCTPGIIVRLSTLDRTRLADRTAVDRALLAHLCRCTGWQTIHEAAQLVASGDAVPAPDAVSDRGGTVGESSDHGSGGGAERRAELEGGVRQSIGPQVALGRGGFADDAAPADALVAVRGASGAWVVAESSDEARRAAGKVQGRRTTAPPTWPVDLPAGRWRRTLQTTWVEPAYLEPDASWCVPGGAPWSPLGNGGAFGGKTDTSVGAVARRLADEHGRAVRVVWSREDVVRLGSKRPPLAIALDDDGTGVVRVGWTAPDGPEVSDAPDVATRTAIEDAVSAVAPGVRVEFVPVVGPSVSAALRAAVWAEVAAAVSACRPGPDRVVAPGGATASASIDADGAVHVAVSAGDPLDRVVLRSYCIGAAHQALGMVRSESIAVGDDGVPLDLTIRSFGILRSVDTPPIEVAIEGAGPPVNGSDAVFAAVLAAAWRHAGHPPRWPT